MSELERFHNMTKPIKFRKLKMVKQFVSDWCKAQRERIKYLFNYLLYKLNILKRYSYRDIVERVVSSPNNLRDRITTDFVNGVVRMKVISSLDINIDYFYYEKKDGSKKITLTLKDHREETLFAVSYLDDISLKVHDQWYYVDNLPTFKIHSLIKPKPIEFVDSSFIDKPIEPRVIEFDVFRLKTFHHKLMIGKMSLSDVSEVMYNYYYECSRDGLQKELGKLTLMDIMK